MAQKLKPALEELQDTVVRLAQIQQKLLEKIDKLTRENNDLRSELEQKGKMLEKANLDVEFLTVSHRLASSPDSIASTRSRLARLIRTIDSCIAMMQEE